MLLMTCLTGLSRKSKPEIERTGSKHLKVCLQFQAIISFRIYCQLEKFLQDIIDFALNTFQTKQGVSLKSNLTICATVKRS